MVNLFTKFDARNFIRSKVMTVIPYFKRPVRHSRGPPFPGSAIPRVRLTLTLTLTLTPMPGPGNGGTREWGAGTITSADALVELYDAEILSLLDKHCPVVNCEGSPEAE